MKRWQNAEGYYDPTAFQALKNIERDKKMAFYTETKKRAKVGDIWKVKTGNGNEFETFVLQVFRGYMVTLTLWDEEQRQNSTKIRSTAEKWTDAGHLGCIRFDALVEYVRTVSDDELEDVRDAVAWALGVQTVKEEEAAVEIETPEIATPTMGGPYSDERVEILEKKLEYSRRDTAVAEHERDVYKKLYEDMLDNMLKLEKN